VTLPRGWEKARLGELLAVVSGFAFKSDEYQDQGHFLIRIGNVQDGEINLNNPKFVSLSAATRRFELSAGDILTSLTGNIGRVARIDDSHLPAALNQRVAKLQPVAALSDAGYLYRFLSSAAFRDRLSSQGQGAAQQNVSPKVIEQIAVPLPPLAEQRRILAKLDVLTPRLARARAELERVLVLAERSHLTILRSAVMGALTADWRATAEIERVSELLRRVPAPQQGRGGREATDKIIPGTAALSVNDPGTTLPGGWEWVPLLRVAKQETGHTPSRSHPNYWDGRIPWIGIRDAGAHHGHVIQKTVQTISAEGLANSSARLLPEGTVCLSRTASVGYITIMGQPMATSQDFATWTCTEALIPEYLMYALMAEGDDIRNFGMGSTHTTIYFPEVRAFHIALPPVTEQREIVARIESALARADRLEAEAARARALLDRLESAILAKAFRGELVPQDPNDEPASVLLDRIRAQRAAAPNPKRSKVRPQPEPAA